MSSDDCRRCRHVVADSSVFGSYSGMVHRSFPGNSKKRTARGVVSLLPRLTKHTPRVRGLAVAYHLPFVTQFGMVRSRTSGDWVRWTQNV